ncbi:hypothetical protein GCM10010211_61590 [Streptomyces albospinus]|uniref:Nudix hydrolase domain-containing protein n=1 Tax=Streptomyces albospinus TaxID=285515 RepID=A0ABQ2VHT8_9ACTN|nr:hypothetical protein GCM10010211_61590 [Streptomyces albospinus]
MAVPGGQVEDSQTAEQAAVRETLEETGLTVEAPKLLDERVHPKTGRLVSCTACSVVAGAAYVADEEELAEVAWIAHSEIPEYVLYGLFGPVQQYLEGELAVSE